MKAMFTQREIDNYTAPVYRKGVEDGRKQGREEGAAQSRAEIARTMLKLGINNDIITKSTGLSDEQVKEL